MQGRAAQGMGASRWLVGRARTLRSGRGRAGRASESRARAADSCTKGRAGAAGSRAWGHDLGLARRGRWPSVDPRRSGSCPTRSWAAMGEAATTGRMAACRGAQPRSLTTAMGLVKAGHGERREGHGREGGGGVNDGLHLATMNTSGSRDDDT
jgi:hypothetical protein